MRQGIACFVVGLAFLVSVRAEDTFPLRTWTSRSGKTIEAAFVSVTKSSLTGSNGQHLVPELRVVLRRRDGTPLAIALQELSAPDRHYVVKCSAGPAVAAGPTKPLPSPAVSVPPTEAETVTSPSPATVAGEGLARDALTAALAKDPELNIEAYLAIVRAMAYELRPRLAGKVEPSEVAGVISDYLFREQQFVYDGAVHFLHDVLDAKRGSSIGLTVLYVALARAVGVPADPERLPRHMLVRLRAGDAVVNVEMKEAGRQLSDADLIEKYQVPSVALERGCYLKPLPDRGLMAVLFLVIGDIFEQEGAAPDAMLAFNRSIALDDRNAEAYQIRARCATFLGRYADAMRDCDAAFLLNPLYGAGVDTPSSFPWPEADWDALMRQFDEVVETQPEDWGAQAMRGILYSWRGFPASGMLALNEALDMNPYSALCRLTRAQLRTDIGDRDGALEDLRSLIDMAPYLRDYIASLGGFTVWHADPDYQQIVAPTR